MQINKTNNVIFLNEFESNIISEAFVVLKEDVNVSNIINLSKPQINGKINILKEAELLINQKINENKLEYEKFKITKLERKMKFLKIINIICIITSITSIILKY